MLAGWGGPLFKLTVVSLQMVAHEYHQIAYVKPKRMAMRKNYPDVRLDINGNMRIH